MILTGEKRSNRRKVCSSDSTNITNTSWPGMGLNPNFRG